MHPYAQHIFNVQCVHLHTKPPMPLLLPGIMFSITVRSNSLPHMTWPMSRRWSGPTVCQHVSPSWCTVFLKPSSSIWVEKPRFSSSVTKMVCDSHLHISWCSLFQFPMGSECKKQQIRPQGDPVCNCSRSCSRSEVSQPDIDHSTHQVLTVLILYFYLVSSHSPATHRQDRQDMLTKYYIQVFFD